MCLRYAPAKCGKFDFSHSFNFATAISKCDTFSKTNREGDRQTFSLFSVSELIFPFLAIGISMYQKSILPYFIISYLFTPRFFPFGALRSVWLYFITTCSQSSFFSTEARGPTRRRNSTGLEDGFGSFFDLVFLCGCERPLSYYSKYGRNSQPHSFSKVMDR